MTHLVLVRHGQSQWNKQNRFTGFHDIGLTAEGVKEAKKAGKLLAKEDIKFDVGFTSYQRRAIKTLWLALEAAEQFHIPCLLYTSPSPRDQRGSRMPSSA